MSEEPWDNPVPGTFLTVRDHGERSHLYMTFFNGYIPRHQRDPGRCAGEGHCKGAGKMDEHGIHSREDHHTWSVSDTTGTEGR